MEKRAYTIGTRAKELREPDSATWIRIATEEAYSARVSPGKVLSGDTCRNVTAARWRALKRLCAESPTALSLAGIGRVTGFDHTSIRNAFIRMANEPSLVAPIPVRVAQYVKLTRIK